MPSGNDGKLNVFINPVVNHLVAMATRAWRKKWMIPFTAPTGVGKSAAVRYAGATLPFPHKAIECKAITGPLDILRVIGLRDGQVWKTHGRHWLRAADLYYQAVELAIESPYLLILDESDRAPMRCLEMLRDLWDDAKVAMLLVGNEALKEQILKSPSLRLARRTRADWDEPPLRKADLRQTLEFMDISLSDEQFDYAWKLAGGSPGFVQKLVETADEIAESHLRKRDMETLAGAAKHFPTLRSAVQR